MKVNQLKAGVILSYLSKGLGIAVSILYTPIMIRLLGQSEYGLYNLVASIVSYLGVLNFGFGSAYIRFYSRYKVKDRKEQIAILNGMFLIIFSLIGLIAVIAGSILAYNANIVFGKELTALELSKAQVMMIILVINLAISFPNIIFNSYVTASEKFIFQNILEMIRLLSNPFIVLPILLSGFGSIGMVIGITLLNITIEIINILYCIKKLNIQFSFKNFDFVLMKEMTVFSSYIFINLIIDQINWNVDKLVIGRFHGTIVVAIYSVAAQLNSYYRQISTTISNVFIPRVHHIVAESNDNIQLTNLFTKIGRIQFIVLSLIASGLIIFGKPFISIWAGENYTDAYYISILLIISVTVSLIQNIGIEIQRAKNMHKFRSLIYFFTALFNLILTIPLTNLFGGIGAALGTSISLIIGNGLIMNWYNHVKIGLNMKYFWRQIFCFFPAFIIPVFFGIIINKLFNLYNLFTLLSLGIVYIFIFGISMWFLGMNQYEKDLVGNPIKKYFRR